MYISPGIVFGFHGCDQTVYDRVIRNGEHLTASENEHGWLGSGFTFGKAVTSVLWNGLKAVQVSKSLLLLVL